VNERISQFLEITAAVRKEIGSIVGITGSYHSGDNSRRLGMEKDHRGLIFRYGTGVKSNTERYSNFRGKG